MAMIDYEAEYNNRALVPEHREIFDRWNNEAESYRRAARQGKRADLGLSTASLQWVVSAYVLGYGGFLLLGGRAADLLGRRRLFIASLAVFVVASALGGLVTLSDAATLNVSVILEPQ